VSAGLDVGREKKTPESTHLGIDTQVIADAVRLSS
jgi:hypothetical protein